MKLRDKQKRPSILKAASSDVMDLGLTGFNEAEIIWALETGLGPLLFQITRDNSETKTSPHWSLVQGAYLTAQVLTAEVLDATGEIIDACSGRIESLTLLKGISICVQHYPAPCLRPMRDIDVLVAESDVSALDELMTELGYKHQSDNPPEFYENHHHSCPFFHPQKGVWIEAHRDLFPSHSRMGCDKVFSRENVRSELRRGNFQGRNVLWLTNELQLLYTATHWATQLSAVGGTLAMLDTIYLFRNAGALLDWRRIMNWLEGSIACRHLFVLLTFLEKNQLIKVDPGILHELRLKQSSFGGLNLKIIHGLIDHCLLKVGIPWPAISSGSLEILWKNLLSEGHPNRNLGLALWKLVSSRLRVRYDSGRHSASPFATLTI